MHVLVDREHFAHPWLRKRVKDEELKGKTDGDNAMADEDDVGCRQHRMKTMKARDNAG